MLLTPNTVVFSRHPQDGRNEETSISYKVKRSYLFSPFQAEKIQQGY